ncbi:MAG: prolipoprotein diacylglyceryl transferase family protein, partial [Desulfovibrionaceae bacterium]
MLQYPDIDPVIIQIGPLALRWYGLAYAAGFFAAYWLALQRIKRFLPAWTEQDVSRLVLHLVIGIIAGARLGYAAFYDPAWFAGHPLDVLAVWKGGMSFHGGLVGAIAGA